MIWNLFYCRSVRCSKATDISVVNNACLLMDIVIDDMPIHECVGVDAQLDILDGSNHLQSIQLNSTSHFLFMVAIREDDHFSNVQQHHDSAGQDHPAIFQLIHRRYQWYWLLASV